MSVKTYRNLQGLLFLITLCVIGLSFYFQYVKGLQPCPLCIMQRLCALLIGLCCLVGLSGRLKRTVVGAEMVLALAGLFFVGRQLWLQALPQTQTSVCMPGLDVLLRYFSWQDIFHTIFWGAQDCAEVGVKWLGLSMPAWGGIYFMLVFVSSAFLFSSRQLRNIRPSGK